MKHKHADLIHAWADGAEIQYKDRGEWYNIENGGQPIWNPAVEFRIKPEEKKPVVRWLWVTENRQVTGRMYTEDETRKVALTIWTKLEWSRTEFPE